MGGSDDEKELPRDARTVKSILSAMGAPQHDPRVVTQLLELVHRYISSVLVDAQVFSEHAEKEAIDPADIRLAIESQLSFSFSHPPSRDLALQVAAEVNKRPFPSIDTAAGLSLPPHEYTLTKKNFKVLTNDPDESVEAVVPRSSPEPSLSPPPAEEMQPSPASSRTPPANSPSPDTTMQDATLDVPVPSASPVEPVEEDTIMANAQAPEDPLPVSSPSVEPSKEQLEEQPKDASRLQLDEPSNDPLENTKADSSTPVIDVDAL
eukprot:Plantae.Rhodophyta-Hildenbrandia_rubra.ctg10766.p2 GENE.Plantae.Rhodophyta-Hildenbrandia_rubra.ctg10766~~Plantae.Rhodophyta-Hildenbrandia_rubra.ctg10766.p2  ORF type:complete len:264 (-),score=57.01 Plantae.Rhodophyta-Hildenbrandia_rubra.ctg10766:594-1385(-)